MKKLDFKSLFLCGLALASLILYGCFKDSGYYHYTMYTPVYKTTAQVRASIKSDVPVAVQEPGKMYLIGNYIFLAEKMRGIHIIDNTNPSNPVNKAFIKIPGCEDMAVYGNTLYADCYTDLMSIDITDPMNVVLKKHIVNLFPDRRSVNGFLVDTNQVIIDWIARDTTIRVEAPQQRFFSADKLFSTQNLSYSSLASSSTGQGGSLARFAILRNYLYTVTSSSLNTVNISQPQLPTLSGTTSLGFGIETIYPFQDKLFIGATMGMQIFSVANPSAPVRLSSFSHARRCDPVIVDNNYAYVTLRGSGLCGGNSNELDVINVQDLLAPSLVKVYPLTSPGGLSKDGNWLFICDGTDGVKCLDATNVNDIKLKKLIAMPEAYDVICTGGKAIVSAKDGLYQYDYSNINEIRLLSKIGLE
ncbi:MAG: hypothetical protein ABIX01_05685 [Chitinophagaceae bacterium]